MSKTQHNKICYPVYSMRNFFLYSIIILAAAIPASAKISGTWKSHPALDIYSAAIPTSSTRANNNIAYMAEGERFNYMLIAGWPYDSRNKRDSQDVSKSLHTPHYFPARLDKTAGSPEVRPLAYDFNLSGSEAEALDYALHAGYAVIAYSNSAIDIIHDDGRIFSNLDLTRADRPGSSTPSAISFSKDEKTFFISLPYGFLEIDPENGETINHVAINRNVEFANRIGNRYVLSIDGALHILDDSLKNPSDSDLQPLVDLALPAALKTADGIAACSYQIIPDTDSSFLYLGPSTSGDFGFSVNRLSLTPPAEKYCSVQVLVSESLASVQTRMALNDYLVRKFPLEYIFSPCRDGFTVASGSYFHHIDYLSDTGNPTVGKYKKDLTVNPDNFQGDERYKRHSSYDALTYTFFRPREGFVCRTLSGEGDNTTWSAATAPIGVNANNAINPEYISYSPEAGIILHNQGISWRDATFDSGQSSGLCSYRDGKWTSHFLYHRSGNRTHMVTRANGAAVDPADPEYLYETYSFTGLLRTNLSDHSDLLHLSYTGAPYSSFKDYFVAITGSSSDFAKMQFTVPEFDGDQTLWTMRPAPNSKDAIEFWYWTKEDRLAVHSPADYAAHPMKSFSVPGINLAEWPGAINIAMPMKQEKNRGLIALLRKNTRLNNFIYNHNGTPDDLSDDAIYSLDDMLQPNGDAIKDLIWHTAAFEDPYDGAILIGTAQGILVTDRDLLAASPKPVASFLEPAFDDGSFTPRRIGLGTGGDGGIVTITSDPQGRKWISTTHDGLYCLSPDRSTILAHFSNTNSPLTAELWGCCYNPDNNSIWVGTELGACEFIPDGEGTGEDAENIRLSHHAIDPDYQGHISIYGLSDAKTYEILNEQGETIATLQPQGGKAQWHPAGLPAGQYTIAGRRILINK